MMGDVCPCCTPFPTSGFLLVRDPKGGEGSP